MEEHSRLLKFITEGRHGIKMAETPIIKIEKEYQNPPNVEADVPGSHKIREVDNSNSEINITAAEFTLSPVITVTKKETTLTKGDIKLQKVTVSEDIAMEESENGGYTVGRETKSFTQTDSQQTSTVTSERREKRVTKKIEGEEKCQDEKKSKIPMLRLRQAVEKVKRERQAQKAREQPRRSSIPKLKNPKKVKRDTSLNVEPKVEDEFEKIYEQIADSTPKDIDVKLLAVPVEDTEKIESKFEEIVHSYDEEEQEKHTVNRVSKIPALRRKDDKPSRLGTLIDRARDKHTTTENKLKDGGFKVTSSTIKTKRFSRGNSREFSAEEHHVNVTETIDIKEDGDTEVFVSETVKKIPAKPARNSIKRLIRQDNIDVIESTENIADEGFYHASEHFTKDRAFSNTKNITQAVTKHLKSRSQSVDFDKIGHNRKKRMAKDIGGMTTAEIKERDREVIITELVTENVQETPTKIETVIHDVTNDINKDNQNIKTSEKVTVEDLKDGGTRTVTTKTIITESVESTPAITETIVRNISREISNDGAEEINNNKGIVTVQETADGITKTVTKHTTTKGIPVRSESFTRHISREMGNIKQKGTSTITIEEVKNDGNESVSKKIITKEHVIIGSSTKPERIHKSISQEITGENINITETSTKSTTNGVMHKNVEESSVNETANQATTSPKIDDNTNKDVDAKKDTIRKESMQVEQMEKEGIRIGIPVYTKVTESFTKGKIQNVEMSRTIEWKSADEVKTKNYSRSVSEKVTKKELKDIDNKKPQKPTSVSEISDFRDKSIPMDMINKTLKDPVLEAQIKDTVKEIADQLTLKKVSEYQSSKQVTNLEKNTYSLSKTVDLDKNKDLIISREIGTQMSVVDTTGNEVKEAKKEFTTKSMTNAEKNIYSLSKSVDLNIDKDLKMTKEIGTQMSVVDSKETELKDKNEFTTESVKTAVETKKRETEYIQSSVKEQNSETQETTILKGNVSRLKDKIAKENDVSKKEIDEELPKKKSVLSKIALFERLEPREPFPVIKAPGIKKCKYIPPKDTRIEDKPYTVDKVTKEIQFESFGYTDKVEINPNYDEVTYVNEPVIIKEHWKSEEGIGNVSAINRVITEKSSSISTSFSHSQIQEVKGSETATIVTSTVDFATTETQVGVAKTLPPQSELKDDENKIQSVRQLPAIINFEPQQSVVKTETLTDKIVQKDDPIEQSPIIPNKTDYEAEIGILKPGKINFNDWKHKVEINKSSVDKIEIVRSENLDEIATLQNKVDLKSYESLVQVSRELLDNNDVKKVDSPARILPAIIKFESNDVNIEVAATLQGSTDSTNDNQNEMNSEIKTQDYQTAGVRLLPAIINFNAEEIEAKIAKPLPAKINIEANKYETAKTLPVELPKILPDIKDTLNSERDIDNKDTSAKISPIELPKILPDIKDISKPNNELGSTKATPGKLNLNLWKNQVEVNKTLVGNKSIKNKEITKSFSKVSGTVQEKYYSNISENKVGIATTEFSSRQVDTARILPGKIEFSATDNSVDNARILPASINFSTDETSIGGARMLPGKIDLKAINNKVQGATTLPATIHLDASQNVVTKAKLLPAVIDISHETQVETAKILPGKIHFSALDNNIGNARILPATVDFSNTEIEEAFGGKNEMNTSETKIQGVRTVPAIIDLSTTENKLENAKLLPATIDFDNAITSGTRTLPGKIELDASNNKVQGVKMLPAAINEKISEISTNERGGYKILPGKVEFEAYDSTSTIAKSSHDMYYNESETVTESVRTLPGRIDFNVEESKVDVSKPLPGKLDLKAWEHQVEKNKTLVDKIDIVKSENLEEIAKTLPGRIDFKAHENKVDIATTLPDKINFNDNENNVVAQMSTGVKIFPFTNKSRLNNFHMGFNIQKTVTSNETVQANQDFKITNDKAEIHSETGSISDPDLVDEEPAAKVNLIRRDSIIATVNTNKYFIADENKVQSSINTTIDNNVSRDYEKRVDELETKSYSINEINTKAEYSSNSTFTENYYDEEVTSNHNTAKEFELYSKIDSVQNSSTELKTIERNISNTATESFSTETNEIEFNSNTYKLQNKISSAYSIDTNKNELYSNKHKFRNEMLKSYGEDDFKTNADDLKRAKSLVDLDLGDVVNGQVNRMVGRLKSVDFGRRESVKTEINAKELPKKMTVWEKIALFESKASAIRNETTTIRTSTTKKTATSVFPEEVYTRKIEELSTARSTLGRLEDMLYLPLGNGTEMPVIALGTALMDTRLLPHLIGAAIDMGYRAIDTAYIYGNEKEVGEAIKAKIDDGTVKREDLFIMSKLWSTFHRTDLVEKACRSSLKNLGLDYFDLYMIHNPMSFKEGPDAVPKIATVLQYSQHDYLDAWYGMEGLVTKGLARSIGVSNFNSQQIQRILDKGKIKPVVNQVECHPYLAQQRLQAFCAERNIILSCFGVLGSKGTPAELKNSTAAVIDDAFVKVMASGLGVTPAQLLIRYQIECGRNAVVKASSAAHLWDNLQALTFTLEQAQVDALHALNKNKRTFVFKGMGDTHRNYPFLIQF